MKKILFPTDFSSAAHNAFQYAIELAKITGAKLDIISVYPEPLKGKDLFLSPEKQRPLRIAKQMEMEQKMTDFCKGYTYNNIGDKVVFPSAFIAQEIIDRSKKSCNLVIMGTKGERNALDKVMGSVTTRTMMNAGCPVLAIPESAKFEGIKQITYATSLTSGDEHFIAELSDFAKIFGAAIHFLNVSDESNTKAKAELMAKKNPNGFNQFSVVNNTSIMAGVDSFLKENPSDILALYIPRRKLWEKLFHKSFSKRMTFHTTIPLFIFHE